MSQDELNEHPSFTRAKALSEPMRSHFPKSVEEARAWKPRARWVALHSRVLVVSQTRVETKWAAYCDVVLGWKHDDEWPGVLERGAKLGERVARAIFPEYEEVPYAH